VASNLFPAGSWMSLIAAVVLAGGRAERLGGINKALIEIGRRTLLERVGDAVAGCAPKYLAVGNSPFDAPGFVPIRDLGTGHAGPLAGVAAAIEALAASNATHLLTLAVDSPFVPRDVLGRATRLIADRDVVVAAYGGQLYPTNALWRLGALRDLPARIRAGTAPHSLKRLIGSLDSIRLDYAGLVPENPFANVNTPDDLHALRARAARGNGVVSNDRQGQR
jgi:molybdopterin-guanine dinucleotide biosynthesis protein A